MIHAPFNFVPLSDKVFFPDWADQISQDIPFSDGISGTIELKITAKTPIFVRNGHTKDDAENKNEEYNSFSKNPDGSYFIPATSIKGCIRNVLEIMSFGKMSFVTNKIFGLRDLDDITYRASMQNIHCGWLQLKGGKYVLEDWGTPKRISLESIANKYEIPELSSFINDSDAFKKNPSSDSKYYGKDCTSVKYKYDLLKEKGHEIASLTNYFSPDMDLQDAMHEANDKDKREFYTFGGTEKGYIVLTGQPGIRKQNKDTWEGKCYEFIFIEPESKCKDIEVPEEIIEAFRTINEDSPAYKDVWKTYLIAGKRIPVFLKLNSDKRPLSIGLSYMFKYPAKKNVRSAIEERLGACYSPKPDMADCLFGYSRKNKTPQKNDSLKGRVQFSAFWSTNAEKDEKCPLALGSPKASYYPIYIDQENNGNDGVIKNNCTYKTYNDGGVKGWKRYHVRKNIWSSTKKEQINTVIYPLKADSIFDGKISFHNLRPEELGALFSALTFHGNEKDCFHQIGMAKPYGFGKVCIEIVKTNLVCEDGSGTSLQKEPHFYMALFEKMVKDNIGTWQTTDTIKQLFTLANKEVADNASYDYMNLDLDGGNNEFLYAKKKKDKNNNDKPQYYLQYYGQLIGEGNIYNVETLLPKFQEDIKKIVKARKERMESINKAIVEQARLEEEKKKQEEERIRQEIEKEKEKEQEAQRIQKIQAGLSFLEEKYEVGNYKVLDFNGAKNRIGQWLKKASKKQIDVDQFSVLETSLIRLASNPVKKEQKDWAHRESKLWKYVESITSEEFAENVFNKINS